MNSWNQYLEEFKSKNIFQSYEWGELKKNEGWEVFQTTIKNDQEKIILLAQVLIKKILGVKIAWCPGGPILQPSSNLTDSKIALTSFTERVFSKQIFNLRCNPYMENTDSNKKIFASLSKSYHTVTSPKTIILDVKSGEDFLKSIKPRALKNIKRYQKHNIDWKLFDGSLASQTFSSIYEQMIKQKKLNYNLINIEIFSKLLGFTKSGFPRVFCFTGIKNNLPVAACIISLISDKAFYHYAASTEEGRDMSASYGMIYELMNQLKEMKIKEMDFGGITNNNSTAGVDFFKLGFNGRVFEKVGEFDISKSKMRSYLFSKAIQLKYNK